MSKVGKNVFLKLSVFVFGSLSISGLSISMFEVRILSGVLFVFGVVIDI